MFLTLLSAIILMILLFGVGSICMLLAKNLGISLLKALNFTVELPENLKNVFGKKD